MTIQAAEEFGLRAGDTGIRVDMVMESVCEREPDDHEKDRGHFEPAENRSCYFKPGWCVLRLLPPGAGACEHLTMVTLSEHFRRRRRE